MYIYFVLNHPAHYHLFKHSIKELSIHGHSCEIFIRPKDVLKDLLDFDKIKYNILPDIEKNSKSIIVSSILGLLKKNIALSKFIFNSKPDLMVGTDWAITTLGRLFNIPSLVLNEDDTLATPENKVFYPFAKTLLLPDCCDPGMWENKRISYSGYHELAYLHPNRFIYNIGIINKYVGINEPYVILRLVKLTASHDKGKKGLGFNIIRKIISLCKDNYKILISFEGDIPDEFTQYSFNFNPIYMHHFLAGASLVIGDSQTMIAEAAILGTPAIRFNDFVGKLSYLNDIENKYGLAFGFKTSEQDKMFLKLEELLNSKNLKSFWHKKIDRLFKDKIDVTAFIVWFIENYPKSLRIIKKNPDYQYNFR
jgi:uncharacterized protein